MKNNFTTHLWSAATTQLHRGPQMPTIDQILLLLMDNKWHNLDEITQKVALPLGKLEKVVGFLSEYNFVRLNQNPAQVKLESHLLTFLNDLKRLEQETS